MNYFICKPEEENKGRLIIQEQHSSGQISIAERQPQKEHKAEVLGGNKTRMENHHLFNTTLNCIQKVFLENTHKRGSPQTTKPSQQENRQSCRILHDSLFFGSCTKEMWVNTNHQPPRRGKGGTWSRNVL